MIGEVVESAVHRRHVVLQPESSRLKQLYVTKFQRLVLQRLHARQWTLGSTVGLIDSIPEQPALGMPVGLKFEAEMEKRWMGVVQCRKVVGLQKMRSLYGVEKYIGCCCLHLVEVVELGSILETEQALALQVKQAELVNNVLMVELVQQAELR